MVLYIVAFVSCGGTLAFLISVFPRLARNTARTRMLREKCDNDQISIEEYEKEESLEMNRISNISTVGPGVSLTCDSILIFVHQVHMYVGYAATYLLMLPLLLAPKTAKNPKVDNYTIVLCVLPPIQIDLIC